MALIMYDYDYSAGGSGFGRLGKGCRVILIATVSMYLLQLIAGDAFDKLFSLSLGGLKSFQLWQLVTYMFLHGSILHILMNMLWFYFMGRDIEDVLGTARFVLLYLCSGVLGGLLWLAAAGPSASCIGASGGVFGLIGAFGAIFAQRRMTLFIFLIPVNIRGRTLAIGATLLTVIMMAQAGNSGVAHLAHLGGLIVGYVYGWHIKKTKGFLFGTEWSQWTPFSKGWISSVKARMRRKGLKLMDLENDYVPEQIEVDKILEKVSDKGVASLSGWERQILDRASRNGVR